MIITVKNNLLEIATKHGITQATIARESELSVGAINRYCGNKQQPSMVSKNRICNAINRLIKKEDISYALFDIFPNI